MSNGYPEIEPPGNGAETTQPGEGAAEVRIVDGVVIAIMPSADQQTSQPA